MATFRLSMSRQSAFAGACAYGDVGAWALWRGSGKQGEAQSGGSSKSSGTARLR